MPVTATCDPADAAVVLNTSAGEHLIYRIETASPDLEWSLVTDSKVVLTDKVSCPSPCERRWPASPDEIPADGSEQHTLSVQFLSEASLDYHVTKRDQSGAELTVVKKCSFTGSADAYFEALRVFPQ